MSVSNGTLCPSVWEKACLSKMVVHKTKEDCSVRETKPVVLPLKQKESLSHMNSREFTYICICIINYIYIYIYIYIYVGLSLGFRARDNSPLELAIVLHNKDCIFTYKYVLGFLDSITNPRSTGKLFVQ